MIFLAKRFNVCNKMTAVAISVSINLCVQKTIDKVRGEIEVSINCEMMAIVRFANDIAVIPNKEKDLKNILEIMNLTTKNEYNMRIIKSKT